MPPVLVLLSLLVGTLEVHAAPLDKEIHQEEMVTRCIVEVLSNALAKPNAPPIDPECKEILKKSSQHSLDEKDEQKQYESRSIKDFGSMEKHPHENNEEVKQSQFLPKDENEEKRHHAEDKSKVDKEEEKKHVADKEESTGHSKERDFGENDEADDRDDEERGEHRNHSEKEEIEKKDRYNHDGSPEAKHDIFGKKVHQTAKSVEEFSEEDEEPRHLEEILKRYPISQSPKEPFFHSDKYAAHSDEISDESDEKEEEKKRSYNPKHNDFAQRFLDYDERRSHQEEQRNHLPSDEDTFHYRGQKSSYGQDPFGHHGKNNYDRRTYHEKESSEESREKRHHLQDSEEQKDHHDSNEESNERELMGHYYEDKRHHSEIKRWPSQKNAQPNYEENNEDSEESKEDIEKRYKDDSLAKQELYRKLKHQFQDSEEDGSYRQEKKQEDKRRYIGDEMVDEMKRYYPDLSYEQNIRHYNEKNADDSIYPSNDKHKRRHSEEETRSFSKYNIPDDPFRWKNRYFENNDNSEEERKRGLQNKNLFPEYDDFDLWGKKQFLDDINHEYGEKKNPMKIPKFEEKRQYGRMDELAQLLNYKKKSVEFPDFYDSGEIKKRHYNERSRLHQRPLTEEEEKQLENLAIMDLELQKIAEKLSNNRQG